MIRAAMDLFWTRRDRAEVHPSLATVVALAFEGQDALVRNRRNASLSGVLRDLNDMRDPAALPYLQELLASDSVPLRAVARYLSGRYPTRAGAEALAQTEIALTSNRLRASQKCWIALTLESARRWPSWYQSGGAGSEVGEGSSHHVDQLGRPGDDLLRGRAVEQLPHLD
jgi:hypothetical protein